MKYFFISSTYKDLIDERNCAIDSINGLDSTKAIAMERISSNPNPPKEVYLPKLRECHLVILILGFEYGTIDTDEGISNTEIEYREAIGMKIPVFVFIKGNNEGLWINGEKDRGKHDKLASFKKKLDLDRTRQVKHFKTPEELCKQIITSIYNYEVENGEIGITNPQFQNGDEFFRPFTDNKQLFNHTHPFFGKDDLVEQMGAFLNSKSPLLIIYGRGGIGKSKILYEFYKRHLNSDHKIWFLRMNAFFTDNSFRQLPLRRKNIIIVDDAHHQQDLMKLLILTKSYPDAIKLILTSRNYGMDYIKAQTLRCGLEPKDLEIIPEITELKPDEMEKLGESILDDEHKIFLRSLIHIARDSPLVLTIGAKLINQNSIDPLLLERSEDFQYLVLSRFRDIQIGDIGDDPDLADSPDLLQLISAIQPINPENTELMEKIAAFLKKDKYKVILIMGKLEDNGILIKKGNKLRITPDVLSDFILSEACISNNRSTGFAIEVFEHFYPIAPLEVISNIAELDWRLNADGSKIDVMSEIWPKLFGDIKTGSNYKRTQILKNLEKIAYYQPGKPFELVKYILDNPSPEDVEVDEFSYYNQDTVKMAIPIILRNISYSIKYLPNCCDVLWSLGRDKKGQLHLDTQHPIRVLEEIAEYHIGKYTIIQSMILDSIERWLQELDWYKHIFSPLDVINPILKKDGEDTSFNGRTISSTPFAISYKNTKEIRNKAIVLVKHQLKHESLKIRLQALSILFEALKPPRSLYGRKISKKESQQWLNEEISILEIFEDLMKNTKNSLIKLDIYSHLWWHARYCSNVKERQIAQRIRSEIQEDFDLKLHRVLLYSFDNDLEGDYHEQLKKNDDFINNFTKEFIAYYSNPQDSYKKICDLIEQFDLIEREANPGNFFYNLGKEDPDYSKTICEIIIIVSESPLAKFFSSFVSGIRGRNHEVAQHLIKEGLLSDNISIHRSLAFAFSIGWGQSGNLAEDLVTVKKLLLNSDTNVKRLALESLAEFDDKFNDRIKKIILKIEIENSLVYANALCKFFVIKRGSSIVLTEKEATIIFSKFLQIASFDDLGYQNIHNICQFFNETARNHSNILIEFFLIRINRAINNNDDHLTTARFDPIPEGYFSRCIDNFKESLDYQEILRKIRDEALDERKRYYCRHLFCMISNGFSPEWIEVLLEWINSKNEKKIIVVGDLLAGAKPEFLIENVDFVDTFLRNSQEINQYCLEEVERKLVNIARYGPRIGNLHHPFPVDVNIKETSEKIAKNFPDGSITSNFYLRLAEYANKWMHQAIKIDEDLET